MSDKDMYQDQTILHEELDINDEDPYHNLRYLGHGGSGSVDEVKRNGDVTQQCFARKQVVLQRGSRRHEMIDELKQEARTIHRLRHSHIIRLVGTYTRGKVFCIVMDPVAETDLQEFLSQVDGAPKSENRKKALDLLLKWPGCLLRSLDYLHEMRVKHRDIKPSNILIKGTDVYLTDFGISRVIPEGYTTGTDGPAAMTRSYAAPEALKDGARRGRAVDIFSLGCVFLEMGTVLIGPPGGRERFRQLRAKTTGSPTYAGNESIILQWIWHLWGHWDKIMKPVPREQDKYARHGAPLPDLAFMMLDPNPETRITSRQLISIISTSDLYYRSVDNFSCSVCASGTAYEDRNLPLHSVFKDVDDLEYPNSPEYALKTLVAPDWEAAKRKWLQHHMWW